MTNDFLHSIGEKHPDLKRYLEGLKQSTRSDWRDYETAKGHLRIFLLTPSEYEECIRFISERLNI
jgi:hypothetical protein